MKPSKARKENAEAPMAIARYFVVSHGDQWKISFAGKLFGPWETKREAIEVAVAEAMEAEVAGQKAAVLVQRSDQLFKAWKFSAKK